MNRLRSAGGVVIAPGPAGPVVAVLHHRRFDEWRLPKGKLREGETFEAAALREVTEELGVSARIVGELGRVSYSYDDPRDGPTRKQVRFYLMECADTGGGIELDTFDQVRWLPPADAASLLTWDNERQMVLDAASQTAC